jgi:hypothetical protein
MDLNEGGVDHGIFHVGLVRDGVEQPSPDVRLTQSRKRVKTLFQCPNAGCEARSTSQMPM